MGTQYQQLTLQERYQIEAYRAMEISARTIAKKLNRSNKTISLELNKCSGETYNAEYAHQQSANIRASATKANKRSDIMVKTVKDWIKSGLSPEQISGRMALEKVKSYPSTNTIYTWLERLNLRVLLPRKGHAYRPKKGLEASARLIPDRVDITQRPSIVDENIEIGHWEGDTVYGQDGYLVTLVERKTRVTCSARVKTKTKAEVTKAIIALLKPYRSVCKTITFDNGGEFAGHKAISKALTCDVYFATPYCSWQRGLNENTNGLLRRSFPKGMCIGKVPKKTIEDAVFWLNMRPRKALNYLTPFEALFGKRVLLITGI